MGEFMSDDVDRDGEALEDLAVPITKNHLLAVPECVVVFAAVMDATDEGQAVIVDRIAVENLPIKGVRRQESLEGFCYLDIFALIRVGNHIAWQQLPVLSVVDCDVRLAAGRARSYQ